MCRDETVTITSHLRPKGKDASQYDRSHQTDLSTAIVQQTSRRAADGRIRDFPWLATDHYMSGASWQWQLYCRTKCRRWFDILRQSHTGYFGGCWPHPPI